MSLILITGAGFSRNWGGWLAAEAFEYLIGQDDLHPRTRDILWQFKDKGGFEAVYQALKIAARTPADEAEFKKFHQAVAGMFHTMRRGFEKANILSNILNFMAAFDAIFTLNQDTLLELQYLNQDILTRSQGKLFGAEMPGLTKAGTADNYAPPGYFKPANGPYFVKERFQPIFKLHGSSNWALPDETDLMLILGGDKAMEIPKQPLLKWYFEEFDRRLAGSHVMIIGYSFGDEHINVSLRKAAIAGARFFIIDPRGVDIIENLAMGSAHIPTSGQNWLHSALSKNIDGASRRDLLRTFSGDDIEYTKINHFMTRHTWK